MPPRRYLFLSILCILTLATEVYSLGDSGFSAPLERLQNVSQSGRLNQIIQNATSRVVSQVIQNAQSQLQKVISERTNASSNNLFLTAFETLVSSIQSRIGESVRLQLQNLLVERTNGSSALEQRFQNLTSTVVSGLVDRIQSRIPGLLANVTADRGGFDGVLQNLTSVLTSELTDSLRTQLRELIADGTLLNGNVDEVIRNLTARLSEDLRDALASQLQTYISEVINDTLPPLLAQILLSPEVATVVSDILSSQDFREVSQQLFSDIITGEQNDTTAGILEAIGTLFNLTDIRGMFGDILLSIVTENGIDIVQDLLGYLLNVNTTAGFTQQLLQIASNSNQSGTQSGTFAALLNTLENVGGETINTILQEVLASAADIPIAEALVGGTIGNQTELLDILSAVNISDILSLLNGGNYSFDISTIGALLQNSTAVQEGVSIITGFAESSVRSSLKRNGVRESCQDGFQMMVEGLFSQEQWALQMLDVSGKINSNLLGTLGSWKFEGSYDQCLKVTAPNDVFKGKYCRTLVDIPGLPSVPGQSAPIMLGYCVPDTCNSHDVKGVYDTAEGLLGNVTIPFNLRTECDDSSGQLETDAMVVTCILVVLGVFMVIGTLYDILAVQMAVGNPDRRQHQFSDGVVNQGYVITDGTTIEKIQSLRSMPKDISKADIVEIVEENGDIREEIRDNGNNDALTGKVKDGVSGGVGDDSGKQSDIPKLIKISEVSATRERSVFEQIMLSFSVYTNGVKILNTEQGAGALGAVNGIRFLSMAWVILGHTYYFANGFDRNLAFHFLEKLNQWTFMSINYATVAVDSFFALSGILVAYLTLKELKKVKGPRGLNWIIFYVHRFWRLTPPYMLVLMVGTVLLPYIASGPMWSWHDDLPFMDNCRETWWTNLLYVNNLVKAKDACMGWTWYLANDMQFYIISPLILLPLFYHVAAGLGSSLVFLGTTIALSAYITKKHEYHVQSLLPYAPLPKDADEMFNLYFPSYTRMGPYIVGLFTGYLLYRWRSQCRIPKIANLVLWILSFGIMCAVVYGPYSDEDDHIMTLTESVVYEALHRTGWGMAICWVVFSCACGHGGWINQVLSWKAFVPLGRLTYCAYLVHPLVMSVFINSRRVPTFFSDYEVMYMFLGHLVLSYGVAFVVSLAFESPAMGIEKAILRKRR